MVSVPFVTGFICKTLMMELSTNVHALLAYHRRNGVVM